MSSCGGDDNNKDFSSRQLLSVEAKPSECLTSQTSNLLDCIAKQVVHHHPQFFGNVERLFRASGALAHGRRHLWVQHKQEAASSKAVARLISNAPRPIGRIKSVGHHLTEALPRHLLDGLPQPTQNADGGAVATGQVASRHRDEVVLAALQVENQDVFHLLLARIQVGRRGAVHENLKVDVHGSACG